MKTIILLFVLISFAAFGQVDSTVMDSIVIELPPVLPLPPSGLWCFLSLQSILSSTGLAI